MEEFWNFKLVEFVMTWPAEWRYFLLTLYVPFAMGTFGLTMYFGIWPERERNRLAGTFVALLISACWPLMIGLLPPLTLFGLMQIWDELRRRRSAGWPELAVIGQTGTQLGVFAISDARVTLAVKLPGQAWPSNINPDALVSVATIKPEENTYVVQHRSAAEIGCSRRED